MQAMTIREIAAAAGGHANQQENNQHHANKFLHGSFHNDLSILLFLTALAEKIHIKGHTA